MQNLLFCKSKSKTDAIIDMVAEDVCDLVTLLKEKDLGD